MIVDENFTAFLASRNFPDYGIEIKKKNSRGVARNLKKMAVILDASSLV